MAMRKWMVTAVLVLTISGRAVGDTSPEAFLLVTGFHRNFSGAMFQVNASTGDCETILSFQSHAVSSVALDPVRQRLYWSNWQTGTIYSSYLNGSHVSRVLQLHNCTADFGGCGSPKGLAVDYVEQLIFYADDVRNHIAVVSTDGSNHRVLLSTEGSPFGLALDLLQEVVYYTVYNETAMIGRVSYNGSAHAVVVGNLSAQPSGITLDRREGRLYWCSKDSRRIDTVRTDGTDSRTILQKPSQNFGLAFLALVGDTLFFSDHERSTLMSVKTDGRGLSSLGGFLIENVRGVSAFDPHDVVTPAQKQNATGTPSSVPYTTDPSSTALTRTVSMTTRSSSPATTQSVTSSSQGQASSDVTHSSDVSSTYSDVTHSSDVSSTSSDVTRMTTSPTDVAAETPIFPVVVASLLVGVLGLSLAIVLTAILLCRRHSLDRPNTTIPVLPEPPEFAVTEVSFIESESTLGRSSSTTSSFIDSELEPNSPSQSRPTTQRRNEENSEEFSVPQSENPLDSSGSSSPYAVVSVYGPSSLPHGNPATERRNGESRDEFSVHQSENPSDSSGSSSSYIFVTVFGQDSLSPSNPSTRNGQNIDEFSFPECDNPSDNSGLSSTGPRHRPISLSSTQRRNAGSRDGTLTESTPNVIRLGLQWYGQSHSRESYGSGGRSEDSSGELSEESRPYSLVTRVLPEPPSLSSNGSVDMDQEGSSVQIHSGDNTALHGTGGFDA